MINEVAFLTDAGWIEEEDAGFLSPTDSSVAVFQLWNEYLTTNTHLWTTSVAEYEELKDAGWRGEDVAFYGVDPIGPAS